MEPRKTVLIVGISSFVGSNLAIFLKDFFRVVGTYYSNRSSITDVLQFSCDVVNKDELQAIMYTVRPDVTIYATGVSSVELCAKDEDYADALNTMGLFNVVDLCQRFKSHLCFISSAYVFSGDEVEYQEMDIPDPSTFYGKNKAAAEFYIQKTSLNYSIFRCCQLYGRGINYKKLTWFEFLERSIESSEAFSCDSLVNVGFLDIQYLAMLIKVSIDVEVKNRLFQVSSTDIMTHYDFAKLYGDVFSLNTDTVISGRWPFPILFSSNFSYKGSGVYFHLGSRNLEGYFKIDLPSIVESLSFTFKRLNGSVKSGIKKNLGEDVQFI